MSNLSARHGDRGGVPLEVVHYQRRRRDTGNFSIESLFERLRVETPDDIVISAQLTRYPSNGILRRLANLIEAPFHQGVVNHVTGDIHYVAILLHKKQTILTIHDCGFLRRDPGLARTILKAFWLTWPVKRVDTVVAVSPSTKDEILRETRVAPDKVRVISNAVVLKLERASNTFETKCPQILFVGTSANKNLARLIAAVRGIPCKLDIIGVLPTEIKQALKDSQVAYSNSWALSEVEMRKRYESCDLVAFPSTYEGFGLPILEGQTVGRPVLTSNADPMRWVADGGACLVDPFDIDSIRVGILRIINDTSFRESIVQEGYRNLERFSTAAMIEAYANLYRRVGGRGQRNEE